MREDFIPSIQDIDQHQVEQYKEMFEEKGWFLMKRFEVLRDELTIGYGGPDRMGVKLRQPEASIFFLLTNHRNKANAITEVEKLLC